MKESFSKIVLVVNLVIVLLLPNLALAAPLTGADADVTAYFYKGMGGFIEDTTNAYDSDSPGDVMWPEAANTRQAFWGHTSKFSATFFDVSSAVNPGNDGQNLDLRYWNGTTLTWTALTLDSQTHPFDTTGINSVSFTVPEDWDVKTINGVAAYYIGTGDGAFSGGSGSFGAHVSQISVLLAAAPAAATPEFTDFVYMTTLFAGAWYVYTKVSKKENTGFAV